MPPSLSEWLDDPVGPPPLPSLYRRRQSGAGELTHPTSWPAALLAPAFAPLLSSRGVTYARRSGLAIDGQGVLHRAVGTLAVDVIRETAATLDALGYDEEARALRWTADDIETSRGALGAFIDALRPLLPAPRAESLERFLDDLTGAGDVPTTALLAAYRAAGAPDDLGKQALYSAAGERWPRRTVRGVSVFKTSTETPPIPADLAAHARALGVPVDALTAFVAIHRPTGDT